ncbi:hypothetical protein TUM12370_03460 [Salmonella enterica subsp. enterica serovar Choleraesuis]|nr:hypothetical protein TUM12370_03460 [Salmonella enterica subsp. enterica serovar Choleraesuis]
MIIGNINGTAPDLLPSALAALLGNDRFGMEALSQQPDGKYNIHDDSLFYIISSPTTRHESEIKSEFHRQYIDIQLLLSGDEVIATGPLPDEAPQLPETAPDLIFIDDNPVEQRITLTPGDYAVFFPGEVHRPTCQVSQPQSIRKVVFKVCKDWLAQQ